VVLVLLMEEMVEIVLIVTIIAALMAAREVKYLEVGMQMVKFSILSLIGIMVCGFLALSILTSFKAALATIIRI
jgi:hypothetical protein